MGVQQGDNMAPIFFFRHARLLRHTTPRTLANSLGTETTHLQSLNQGKRKITSSAYQQYRKQIHFSLFIIRQQQHLCL